MERSGLCMDTILAHVGGVGWALRSTLHLEFKQLIKRLKQPWSNICLTGELHVTLTWQLPTNKLHDHVCARTHARNRPAPPKDARAGMPGGGCLGEDSHDGSRLCHLAM